jgi:hypothetical protein
VHVKLKRRVKIMLKRLFTFACLLGLLGPSAWAQSAGRPAIAVYSDDLVVENLCAPDVDDGLYDETRAVALDDSQLARLRVELLERGLDPGFDPDAIDADARLADAIRLFQAEFSLPVTGEADAATLSMLSVPLEKSSDSGIQQATLGR